MNRILVLIVALMMWSGLAFAQDTRKYDEGVVVQVSSIRIKDGQSDNYMAWLAGPYKRLMDEQVKAGLVMSWSVYSRNPRSPQEANLYLTTVYPNMAIFDGLEDKVDAISSKELGESRAQGEKRYADRGSMREVLGSELIRELKIR